VRERERVRVCVFETEWGMFEMVDMVCMAFASSHHLI
jgi:hypothetical protein